MTESAPAPTAATTARRRFRRQWYDVIDVVLFCAGLVALLVTSARYAEEFPYFDEWRYCDFFQGQSFWQFIRTPHNEHNIWVFKALTLPLVQLTGWNTRISVLVGLGVYGAATSLFFLLIRRQTTSPFLRCAAALLLVLPGAYENLTWAWQTTFHLCYLFSVGALWALELAVTSDPSAGGSPPAPGGWRRAGLFGVTAALGVLALFSVGGGVAYALGLVAALTLAVFGGVARRGRERWAALGSAALLGASVLYYLHISPHPSHHAALLLPWQEPGLFARDVVGGLGLALSYPNDPEVAFRAGVFGLVVIGVGIGIALSGRRALRAIAVAAALTTALIAPAMIAVARGRFGVAGTVAPRYVETGIVVALPFFWALGRLYERRSRALKIIAVLLALAAPANAARVITPALAHMAKEQSRARAARRCWRQNGAAPKCITKNVYPFAQYVSGCLETLHSRWGNWGHLGGD